MEFRLLGPLEVRSEGRLLPVAGAKQRALLTLLVLNANRVVPLERMIDALWGESPPRTATHTIRVFVSDLRRQLVEGAGSPIVTQAPGYLLSVAPEDVDATRFERLVAAGRAALELGDADRATQALQQALDLWHGPPLADTAYESFTQAEIARLEELRLAAREARIDAGLALGQHAELVAELHALIDEHPLRERLRAQLMLALYRGGRQAEALDVFQETRRALVDELAIVPSGELVELEKAILNQDPSLQRPSAPSAPASPLPAPLTELIDRDDELAQVGDLLRSDGVRLVTLTGPGGTGKTRLAVEVARRCEGAFAAGAAFVPLEALAEPVLVPSAVAQALGLREAAGEPIEVTVERFLRPRSLLLVVDNFEHLLPAAPLVARLLTSAPGLTVLATSRARLRLRGEHEVPVPPLPLPEADGSATPERLLDSPAAQLFVARAKAARPDFELTPENAAAVAAVCIRLDGLPLALELAAAASKVLSPEAQLARSERRLLTPPGGAGDLPPRQQTLRETIAWSSNLLPASERTLFARLAVFSGEFGLEGAEAVAGPGHVLGGLTLLADQSLVLARPAVDEPRFSILPTIREYAQDLLESSGELLPVARRHAEHYRALAEQAEPELWGGEQAAWLARLDREQANLRAALAWWRDAGDPEELLRIAIALRRWWSMRGRLSEGLGWFEEGLALSASESPLRISALEGAARLARDLAQTERAQRLFGEQLRLSEALGEQRGAASALSGLASVASWEGDRDESEALQQRSVELFRELGDDWGQAAGLVDLSDLALYRGDFVAAVGLSEDALELFRRLDDRRAIAISLVNRGFSLLALGRAAEARVSLSESLAISTELGDALNIVYCLEGLAGSAEAEGEDERAGRLLGRAQALREATGAELAPFEQALHARTIERVGARFGEAALAAAVKAGRSEPLERADDVGSPS